MKAKSTKSIRPNHIFRMALGTASLFLLVWAELAVGILGTPLAGS